jgi:hypothetical protein
VVQVLEKGEGRLIPLSASTAAKLPARCAALPGAGAKQERRLFRELPELLSTVANGPIVCRGFSVYAGRQSVWITLGVKGSQVQILSSRAGRALVTLMSQAGRTGSMKPPKSVITAAVAGLHP